VRRRIMTGKCQKTEMNSKGNRSKKLFLVVGCILLASLVAPTSCAKSTPERDTQLVEVNIPVILQEGNDLPKIRLQPKRSPELEDNHICVGLGTYYKEGVPIPSPFYFDSYGDDPELAYSLGCKWIRISFDDYVGDPLDWQNVEVEPGKYLIKPESEITGDEKLSGKTYPATHPSVGDMISDYAKNNITIVLNLGVGNEENRHDVSRFRDKDTLERYCDYVRFMVNHFKDRIEYYEIWNEPQGAGEDYINLVKHVVPVIREEYPEAKIVIGALSGEWVAGHPGYDVERYSIDADYIKEFLGPDLAPIIDVISWHPLYDNKPSDPYYQNYSQMVNEIKEFAASNGFKGEYLAEEITWRTYQTEFEPGEQFSENAAKKYYARAIIMHRGLNVTASILLRASGLLDMIPNICTVMAGAEPIDLPIEIQSEATNIKSYGFSLSNGDKLLALWTDGVAVDDDPGIEATITLPGFSAQKVTGIDVLNGFEQELVTSTEDGNLVIQNLLVKDYPIILGLGD